MFHLMEPNELIGWVLLGLVAGLLARFLMPGEGKGSWLITIFIGIIGAVVGGWIGRHVGFLPQPTSAGIRLPSFQSVVTATVGSLMVLSVWKFIRA